MIWACNAEKHPNFAFRGGACMCVGVTRTLWKLRHTTPSWTESMQALFGCIHARRGSRRCGGSHSLPGVDALGWWPRPACRANAPPRSKSLLRSQNNLGGESGSPTQPVQAGWTRLVCTWWRCCGGVQTCAKATFTWLLYCCTSSKPTWRVRER